MTFAAGFIAELRQEAGATRRLLERVPEEHYDWKPHPKSMSLGQLAMHLAVLPRGITDLITPAVAEAPVVPLPVPHDAAALLGEFESSVDAAVDKLTSWSDEDFSASWTMTREGAAVLEMPRFAMFRSVMLNHWYHHRGQLTVYLRLLDVPLPSIYGPTADEKPF